MTRKKTAALLVFALAVCIGTFLFWKNRWQEKPPSQITSQQASTPRDKKTPEPQIKYPVKDTAKKNTDSSNSSMIADAPLPQLEEIDQIIPKKISKFFGKNSFNDLFIFEDFIQHVVVSVDNSTGRQIAANFLPVQSAPGDTITATVNGEQTLSEKNYLRYKPYVELAQAANLKEIASYYSHIYPLFQSAYEELRKQGYFNDRLIEAIDNLLATPEIKGPIRLIHPSVHYEFLDHDLESLSAIQKILLRMGPSNAKIIKGKFKELRELLTHLK